MKKTDEISLNHSKIHEIFLNISPNGSPRILKKKKLTIDILSKLKYLNSQEKCLLIRDYLVAIFRTSTNLGIRSFLEPLNDRQKNVLLSNLKAESLAFGISSVNRELFR